MKDRYLFRGKRIDNGEWTEGNLFYAHHAEYGEIYGVSISVDNRAKPYKTHEIDPATIGHCTGLKDKNGRLIFEGDILDKGYDICVVAWFGVWASFEPSKGGKAYGNSGNLCSWARNGEIIGNIHDNPELMEVTKCEV